MRISWIPASILPRLRSCRGFFAPSATLAVFAQILVQLCLSSAMYATAQSYNFQVVQLLHQIEGLVTVKPIFNL